MRKLTYILITATALLAFFQACNKEQDTVPENPYSKVVYPTEPAPVDTLNKLSFVWLHHHIFETSCATPGCHDGNFEPDFRSIGSSYSTLVYHPITKNNLAESFTYRVLPGDTAMSVLHERLTNCCFVNTNDRMPQDNISVPLPDSMITAIEGWILDGARDMFGNIPPVPDKKPTVTAYLATTTDFQTILSNAPNRIDTVYYNPFIVPQNFSMNIIVQPTDDITPMANFTVNKLLCSYEMDNFSPSAPGYRQYNATYLTFGNDEAWYATVNTADFAAGKTVYMRYYVNDGEHAVDTEFPTDGQIAPYKTYWSFYVQP